MATEARKKYARISVIVSTFTAAFVATGISSGKMQDWKFVIPAIGGVIASVVLLVVYKKSKES